VLLDDIFINRLDPKSNKYATTSLIWTGMQIHHIVNFFINIRAIIAQRTGSI
jgi:hypothetical protein